MPPPSSTIAIIERLFTGSLLDDNRVKRVSFTPKKFFGYARKTTHVGVFPRVHLPCPWKRGRRGKKIFIAFADEIIASHSRTLLVGPLRGAAGNQK